MCGRLISTAPWSVTSSSTEAFFRGSGGLLPLAGAPRWMCVEAAVPFAVLSGWCVPPPWPCAGPPPAEGQPKGGDRREALGCHRLVVALFTVGPSKVTQVAARRPLHSIGSQQFFVRNFPLNLNVSSAVTVDLFSSSKCFRFGKNCDTDRRR
jgi:hypothetical protein